MYYVQNIQFSNTVLTILHSAQQKQHKLIHKKMYVSCISVTNVLNNLINLHLNGQ